MKIKKVIFTVSILAFCLVLIVNPLREKISNIIVKVISNCSVRVINSIYEENLKKAENGEIISGKDTILIWGKKYHIVKSGLNNEKNLTFYENNVTPTILKNIIEFKHYNKLYVCSEEGYAVIDKEDNCRIFIKIPEEDFKRGYYNNEKGEYIYYSKYVESEYIEYLKDFQEFTKEEKDILKSLEK